MTTEKHHTPTKPHTKSHTKEKQGGKMSWFGIFLAISGAFWMALYPPSVRSVYADGAKSLFTISDFEAKNVVFENRSAAYI